MNFKSPILLIIAILPALACSRLGLFPTPTPLPLPADLATTPLPDGSQPGKLEATYVSAVSDDGFQDERCYKLFRFYPDGVVLYANFTCLDTPPSLESWSEIDRVFDRQNQNVLRGDYYLLGQRIWVRIVVHDAIHEITSLRSFQGEICDHKMVLQEPTKHYFTGVPSALMQPVLEFIPLQITSSHESLSADCHVAGFRLLFRPTVVLSGGRAEYQIQTDPGETCTLQYTAPDGGLTQAQGTGAVIADSQGICKWIWELGELEGDGLVTVTIDQITQDFSIDVR
ncbi:MAG: hypothetical protein R6V73_09680 [Anaerolineales bacterium]|jgi:hypothetical protein